LAFVVQIEPMPPHARVNGSDSLAAGRARQRLKLAALGYVNARHGIDASVELVNAGLVLLCKAALEFVESFHGALLKTRRIDLRQGSSEMLKLAAIAYANARHGIDADVGMAREGLALLCQAAIDYVESLPREDAAKRSTNPNFQLGEGRSS
jgi:hypothetical protein